MKDSCRTPGGPTCPQHLQARRHARTSKRIRPCDGSQRRRKRVVPKPSASRQETSLQNTLWFISLTTQKGEKCSRVMMPATKRAHNAGGIITSRRFASDCHAF